MVRASSVVAGLAFVPGVVPLCSYVRVELLQGVAFAGSLSSTKGTAWLETASATERHCRPAVFMPCWAFVAEPEDLFVAFQGYFGRKKYPCTAFRS